MSFILFNTIDCVKHHHHHPHHHHLRNDHISEDVELVSTGPEALVQQRLMHDHDHHHDHHHQHHPRLTRVTSGGLHTVHVHPAKLLSNHHHIVDDHGEDHHHVHLQRQISHRPNRPNRPFRPEGGPHKPDYGYGYGGGHGGGPEIADTPAPVDPVGPGPIPANLDDERETTNSEREMLEVFGQSTSPHNHHAPLIAALRAHGINGDGIMIGNHIYTSDPLLVAALAGTQGISNHDAFHDDHHHHHHLLGHDHFTPTGYILSPPAIVASGPLVALATGNEATIARKNSP